MDISKRVYSVFGDWMVLIFIWVLCLFNRKKLVVLGFVKVMVVILCLFCIVLKLYFLVIVNSVLVLCLWVMFGILKMKLMFVLVYFLVIFSLRFEILRWIFL